MDARPLLQRPAKGFSTRAFTVATRKPLVGIPTISRYRLCYHPEPAEYLACDGGRRKLSGDGLERQAERRRKRDMEEEQRR